MRLRVMRMVVPLPISDSVTAILPWWYSSTIRRESDNPRPQPRVLVVKPGSKMRFQLLLGIQQGGDSLQAPLSPADSLAADSLAAHTADSLAAWPYDRYGPSPGSGTG